MLIHPVTKTRPKLNIISRSSVCVENMSSCPNCIASLKRGLMLRKDLVGVCCDAFSRIFSGHHDNLVKQVKIYMLSKLFLIQKE